MKVFNLILVKSLYGNSVTLQFYIDEALLRPFSLTEKPYRYFICTSTGVPEQNENHVIFTYRRLIKSKQGFSQIQKEALAVAWAVTRLLKHLFGLKLHIAIGPRALKFIYCSIESLHRSPTAMVQRWNLELSAYGVTIERRVAKRMSSCRFSITLFVYRETT